MTFSHFRNAIKAAGLNTPDETVLVRFHAKIEQQGECWVWTAALFRNGYGKFAIGATRANKEITYAHRASYRMFIGEIQKGCVVCHRCDNRACVNPAHLFAGTQLENIRDCIGKGRARHHTGPRPNGAGENHGNHKLTAEIVREIRTSSESNAALGHKFSVNYRTIWAVRARKLWKHIEVSV